MTVTAIIIKIITTCWALTMCQTLILAFYMLSFTTPRYNKTSELPDIKWQRLSPHTIDQWIDCCFSNRLADGEGISGTLHLLKDPSRSYTQLGFCPQTNQRVALHFRGLSCVWESWWEVPDGNSNSYHIYLMPITIPPTILKKRDVPSE